MRLKLRLNTSEWLLQTRQLEENNTNTNTNNIIIINISETRPQA